MKVSRRLRVGKAICYYCHYCFCGVEPGPSTATLPRGLSGCHWEVLATQPGELRG